MAKTVLNAVNEILKRVGITAGEDGELTSLTDSSRQVFIDLAVQVIQEAVDDLYLTAEMAQPEGQAEATLTLQTNVRAYNLKSDLVRLRFPLVDRTNNQFIHEAKDGYNNMLLWDPEQDDTGLPLWGAIRPTDAKLYVDRLPTSDDNGKAYKYQYDRDISLKFAGDLFPFTDATFRAMVPVWSEYWKRARREEFDASVFRVNLGRAAGLLKKTVPRGSYWRGR